MLKRYFFMMLIGLMTVGCSVKSGDYVTYESDDYVFMENSFINKQMDCVELGELKQGGIFAKYCVGENYASQLVQGFVFEHQFNGLNRRFIGANLVFEAKKAISIPCSSETIDGQDSGKEYITCMLPRTTFDIFAFIQRAPEEIQGTFKAAVGDNRVYEGVIDQQGKALLKKFYKDRAKQDRSAWKQRSL